MIRGTPSPRQCGRHISIGHRPDTTLYQHISPQIQTRPRPQALKPPILLIAQDESRLVSVIQRCTAFEDEVEEHKRKIEEEEEEEPEVIYISDISLTLVMF